MHVKDGIKILVQKYSLNEWYDSVGTDKYGRYIVYVKTMNYDIMNNVQHFLGEKQVLLSYASFKPENSKQYITPYVAPYQVSSIPAVPINEVNKEELYLDEETLVSVDDLIAELDRLEKICGSHGLQDIFYEIHDGKNAVTNLGSKYPDVKRDMYKLYDRYGFDIIYEELDG